MNTTPTPHDTGDRLQPTPWVRMGITGIQNPRPAQPDDYGRVDFDDAEGATQAHALAAVGPDSTIVQVAPQVAPVLDVVIHGYGPGQQPLVTVRVTEGGEVTVTNHTTDPAAGTSVSVTLAVEVTDDDVDHIMETALSGGIGYWTSEVTTNDNGIWLIADAAFNDETYTVTRADIRRALRLAASPGYRDLDVSPDVHNDIQAAMQPEGADGLDVGEIDATAADQLVQIAAMGRVTYA